MRDADAPTLRPDCSNASRTAFLPPPPPLFFFHPQRVAVEETRGVLPVLGVSPEPRAHPSLHTESARQRLLQAAVRHHEGGQENQILPGMMFIWRKDDTGWANALNSKRKCIQQKSKKRISSFFLTGCWSEKFDANAERHGEECLLCTLLQVRQRGGRRFENCRRS